MLMMVPLVQQMVAVDQDRSMYVLVPVWLPHSEFLVQVFPGFGIYTVRFATVCSLQT